MSEEAGPSNESDFTLHKCEIIRGQSRRIIYNVYNFLKKLSSPAYRQTIDFSKTQELTIEACKVGSVRSISRIIDEAKKSTHQSGAPIFKSPGKTHNKPKSKTNLDDFEKDVLRRTILQFNINVSILTVNYLLTCQRRDHYLIRVVTSVFFTCRQDF